MSMSEKNIVPFVHEFEELTFDFSVDSNQSQNLFVYQLQCARLYGRSLLLRQSVVRDGPAAPTFLPGFFAPFFRIPFRMRSAIRLRSNSATAARMVNTSLP